MDETNSCTRLVKILESETGEEEKKEIISELKIPPSILLFCVQIGTKKKIGEG